MLSLTTAILVVVFGVSVAAPALPADATAQQVTQELEGVLQEVDLVAMEIVVTKSDAEMVTLHIDEYTEVTGPEGTLPIERLQGSEGSNVVAHYVEEGGVKLATRIELID